MWGGEGHQKLSHLIITTILPTTYIPRKRQLPCVEQRMLLSTHTAQYEGWNCTSFHFSWTLSFLQAYMPYSCRMLLPTEQIRSATWLSILACSSNSHLLVIPTQLMRPGISQNVSCAVADSAWWLGLPFSGRCGSLITKSATCGCVSANTTCHQLCWDDWKMGPISQAK